MATKKKLKEKLILRKSLESSLDTVEAFTDQCDEETDPNQILVRLDMIDNIFREYNKTQSDIEKLDCGEAPLAKHLIERQKFETGYCTLKGWLMSRKPAETIPPVSTSVITQQIPPSSVSPSFHLRLPKIDLPKFDGDFSRWLGFRDTFKSMVHDVLEIPPVAKLQFLLQSLEGEARKPYETVDIEAANYHPTWEALLKRYDNTRFLKKQLFRALHDLSPISRENPQDFRKLVDDFQRHVRALAKLGENIYEWDTPLVCMMCYKLDPMTLRAWEEYATTNDQDDYEHCIEYLYQRLRILQTVSSEIQHRSQVTTDKPTEFSQFPRRYPPPKAIANVAAPNTNTNINFPTCIACPESHYLYQCPTFQTIPVSQRIELVSKKGLCWNCFKTSHVARSCDSKYSCRHCHERHHTLLHQSANPVQPSKMLSSTALSTQALPAANMADPNGTTHPNNEVSVPVQHHSSNTVFLSTIIFYITDKFGNEHQARALIDSGSQSNFISKKLANQLCLNPEQVNIPISGIGEMTVTVTKSILADIRSRVEVLSIQTRIFSSSKTNCENPSK
ncbi:uncharacterized protein LOC129767095 [Toxorhynchites rutilus septentrionalis]|uniref:uncharacterized protein LOC129767095 n=1 Tax=Toxorhynchites rutilus septentrionalis TaxID=329112 RepID=UPI0024793071|nr:uncharacterized protein LOC129767095 [Toxorhynchites rutilus septentrionalis]